jgi:hypothetical protein
MLYASGVDLMKKAFFIGLVLAAALPALAEPLPPLNVNSGSDLNALIESYSDQLAVLGQRQGSYAILLGRERVKVDELTKELAAERAKSQKLTSDLDEVRKKVEQADKAKATAPVLGTPSRPLSVP